MSVFTKHNKLEVPNVGLKNWDAITAENFGLIEKGNTMKAVTGITVSAHEIGYIDSSQEWGKAQAAVTKLESRWLGFFIADANQNTEVYARHIGNHKNINWNLTSGPVYLSDTIAGAITQVEPVTSIIVGWAIGTNEIQIKPWSVPPDITTIAGEGHISILPTSHDSVIQGTWGISISLSQTNYIYRYSNSSTHDVEDGLRYKVYMSAGTYSWKIIHTGFTDRGILGLSIDGVSKATMDLYTPVVEWDDIINVSGINVRTTGLKNVDIMVNSKNASSSNHYAFITTMVLYRTA